jgi:DNA-binding protein H-NS
MLGPEWISLAALSSRYCRAGCRSSRTTKLVLSGMSVEALMDLRNRVDEMLVEHRAKLIEQLERIAVVGSARVMRGGGSALRGRKVPPKYRSRSGETWAGRGARPRWMVAALKKGKKMDDFLIKRPRS